jgi:hypothetical protein
MSRLRARNQGMRPRPRRRPSLERLEGRALLATVTVNAATVVRPVSTQLLGVNLAWWDSNLNTAQTKQMVQAAGLTSFRFPGGSSSDDFHFNAPPSYNGQGTDASMASFIASVGGQGVVTLDYGSGSPQEAAAFLAYLNAPAGNTTQIGTGQEWNNATSSWQNVNWQTAGYWASLRAATPLAKDDGLNFLRLGHAAPFGFHYFEVGNEEYGGWEIDHHAAQHDPATYIAFAKTFQSFAATIDPTISVGLDVGSPGDFNNWTANILQQSASRGLTVGFLSDHNYVQAPGSENDANLLLHTVSDTASNPNDPGNPYDWAVRASAYQKLLTQYLGTAGGKVELMATEFNSVYSNPGKQTTSLVNGLFLADSLGVLLNSPYSGANVWDLRNSWETGGNNSSGLYGWRQGGDYGLLGSLNGSPPSSGAYTPYPTYFAEQLASKIIQAGGSVVQVSSNDPNLTAYAIREANGHLELLVVNKSGAGALTGQFQISGFQPASQATVWQYGQAQDAAQSHTTDGHSALANFIAPLSLNGSNFSYSFPAYSMTVLDLSKGTGGGGSGPTITQAATATPSPVTGTTTALAVAATDPAGAASLTFTWATVGAPAAPVSFSANGTNAAHATTATFAKAGTYTFHVTATDPNGLIASSSVTVMVNQTLTAIVISPAKAGVTTGGTQQFSATADDQFGNALTVQPAFAWSVAGGGGTIGATTGLYTAPSTAGTATVKAASGSVSNTAGVTITKPTTGGLSATVAFADTNDWGSGFTGAITITDTGTTPINGWTLQFDFAGSITQIWNAQILSHVGSHYVIQNLSYNATIAPGQGVGFGFNATPGGGPKPPANYVINGVAVAPPPPAPPSPVHASVAFADVSDWGSGFTGSLTITNTGTAAINGWALQFDFAGSITSIWNAAVVTHAGNHYVIQDAGYDRFLSPGQSVSIGFNATPGGHLAGPVDYVLNGTPVGGAAAAASTKSIAVTGGTTPTGALALVRPASSASSSAKVLPLVLKGLTT